MHQQVTISLRTEFENVTVFNPGEYSTHDLTVPLDQVVAWSTAFPPLRTVASAA